MAAAERGNLPLIQLLHSKGAKLDQRTTKGDTALSLAVRSGKTPDPALWLLDQGVSADGAYPYKKGTATLAELLAANKRMKDSPQKAELAQRLGAK